MIAGFFIWTAVIFVLQLLQINDNNYVYSTVAGYLFMLVLALAFQGKIQLTNQWRKFRDLPRGPGGDHACVHRGCSPVPAALHLPAEADPAGYEGWCRCRDRRLREERARQKSVLDLIPGDGRAGTDPSCGPGDGTAGGGDDYGDGVNVSIRANTHE